MNYSHNKPDIEYLPKDISISTINSSNSYLSIHKRNSSLLETARTALYRYEANGILVYDSHARISDQQDLTFSGFAHRTPSRTVKRQIEKAEDYGKKLLR